MLIVRFLVAVVGLISFVGLACAAETAIDPSHPRYESEVAGTLVGEIRIAGADAMANLLTLWSERMSKEHPKVTFRITAKGSSTAIPALIRGEADIGVMARPLKEEEIAAFTDKFGRPPVTLGVASDMIGVYVHKDNPIAKRGLTLAQVDAIFSADRKRGHEGDVTTWGDVGLDGEWKDRPVTAYGRNSASATYGYFKQAVLLGGSYKESVKEQPSGPMLQAVAVDATGITYGSVGHGGHDQIVAVPLAADDKGPKVPLDPARGDYPLRRSFFLVVDHDPQKWFPPPGREFLRLIYSHEGQSDVIRDGHQTVSFADASAELAKVRIVHFALDHRLPRYVPKEPVVGHLRSLGDDGMNNVMTLWAEQFMARHPGTNIEIEGKGGSTPPPAFIAGTIDFGPMFRAWREAELAAFRAKFGHDPLGLRVGIDQLAVFVHKDNPIAKKGLTLAQLDAIFSSTRKQGHATDIVTWGDLGLEGQWNDHVITIHGRNPASGTYGYFKTRALAGGDFKKTLNEQAGSTRVVAAVGADLGAIGFSGVGYASSEVAIVPLKNEQGEMSLPTAANAQTYPLSRFLKLYLNHKPGSTLPAVRREFLMLVFSRTGQLQVVRDGYLPLDAEQCREELKKVGLELEFDESQ